MRVSHDWLAAATTRSVQRDAIFPQPGSADKLAGPVWGELMSCMSEKVMVPDKHVKTRNQSFSLNILAISKQQTNQHISASHEQPGRGRSG